MIPVVAVMVNVPSSVIVLFVMTVPPMVKSVVASQVVNVPAAGVVPPTIPSNVPALISAVLATNPAPNVTAPENVPPEPLLTVSDTVKLL